MKVSSLHLLSPGPWRAAALLVDVERSHDGGPGRGLQQLGQALSGSVKTPRTCSSEPDPPQVPVDLIDVLIFIFNHEKREWLPGSVPAGSQ